MDVSPKFCVVCGMPLVSANDYPEGADLNFVDWCKYCGDKMKMKEYSQLVDGMAQFIKNSQGVTDQEARTKAEEAIKGSPAYLSGRLG